ncbi:unnamed protein product [Hyaloperonospora brassicae]|uniref:PWWP domain-containing protein n=1 Tax=Hyaloperonospora brassicae TaxID=162125 RepID=A0AAV0TLP1_HYABA|nr:unnamed protein product [Hyaloperonospora brassicae]
MTKRDATAAGRFAPPKVLLQLGDWIDVLDGDGVWNVARVIDVRSSKEVKITYDGWPKDYDEVVLIDSDRVAPYHTFTWSVKCWVKYLNWPLWPSLITVRTPGTVAGIRNLEVEDRIYVDFLDNTAFGKRDRCWQKVSQIRAFGDNFDRKRAKSTGANFEKALARVLQSDASSEMPEFAIGTLPVKYKSSPAQCVEALRKSMGDELWFQHFTYSRKHHAKTYVYDTSREKVNDKGSHVSPALNVRRLDLSAAKEGKCQAMMSEKKSLAGTKLLHELEVVDISDGSEVGDKHVIDWQASGTLQQKRQSDGSPGPTKAKRQKAKPFAPIHASKPSNSVADIAVEERKAGYVKGQTKMAAKRSIRPNKESVVSALLNLSSTHEGVVSYHSEERDVNRSPTFVQSRTDSERSAAEHLAKRARLNDPTTLTGRSSVKASKQVKMKKRQTPANKKKQDDVRAEGQYVASADVPRHGQWTELNGCRLHGASQTIPSNDNHKESSHARQPNEIPSRRDDEVFVSSMLSKMHVLYEGDEVDTVDKNRLPLFDGSPHSDRNQELRGRFCVMHADHKDGTKKAKCSNKTVISIPRRFKENPARQKSYCGASSSALSGPRCSYYDPALAAPTPVFSSSNSFSMKSWFKRLDSRFS